MLRPIHPFPARMAPEIALKACEDLPTSAVILDPMCGSGTTLRTAVNKGLLAIGSDLDPLAVLISKVNTTYLERERALAAAIEAVEAAKSLSSRETHLPWVDNDRETADFIAFWFAKEQIIELRKLITVIHRDFDDDFQSFLKVTLSRLIITKEMGASLARDTSHSRPHRVALTNDFDVYQNFIKSAKIVASRLPEQGTKKAQVTISDARKLKIKDGQIDAVITSPPYLNAIDYMRGSKMSLVWLGHKISDLREVRGISIGAEKKPDASYQTQELSLSLQKKDFYNNLDTRHRNMFDRYALDMLNLMREIERVLKPGGKAILVVGNSCLKGTFVENTAAVIDAAKLAGFNFRERDNIVRRLPENNRYLPMPSLGSKNSLGKRMRTESTLTFIKPA